MKTQLNKAIVLAATKFDNKFDKGGDPYILHCLAVMYLLPEGVDDEVKQIAVLHDVIEDTDTTYRELAEQGFSQRVITGVMAMTKQRGQHYEDYKTAVKANNDAILVKMADLTHNSDIRRLKGITEKDIARTVKYQQFFMELKQCLK